MAILTDNLSDSAAPEDASVQLTNDLKALRADLDTLASDVAALGRNQLQRMRGGAADLARAGEAVVSDVDDSVRTAVHDRPIQSLALAFFAGYLFSALVR